MKKLITKMDKPLLILTFVYSVFGLIMIFSASNVAAVLRYDVSPYYFFIKQLIFLIIAYLFSFIVIIRFPTKNYKKFVPLLVIGILVALFGLFVYGNVVNSAQSWYRLGGIISIQPSEFAKTILIIYFAMHFGLNYKEDNEYGFLRPLAIGISICLLVAAQPDFGGALIIAGIVFFLLIGIPVISKQKIKILSILGGALIIIVAIFLYTGSSLFSSTQLSRLTFQDPCSRYTEDSGYQVCNGFIAVSNGGLIGKGLGNSTQKYLYLPEAHTDFIFPIVVEELGIIAATIVLLGYAFMLYRILKIAKKSVTLRGSIIAYGTFLFMLMHILVNLLGVFAIIPLTGVPLPFLSYGGSFNLNLIVLLFLTQRVAIETKKYNLKKELKSI
ncbi:MAG TPA: FtsW/RodA/SpoVE family cell cycle protein [Bacilli bacterium]|nr:FtsW/RodA/SpoVE family cell cycle protein [Bacilli bacterium]